ncbi:MAG: RNA pseudouridine synthase [Treponema sp.]|nr:RNA pseudouridine synthase [Treponema sp.]
MHSIKIIKCPSSDFPYLVIYKPHNLPSAPINMGDKENALSQALELFPELNNVKGKKEIEKGLLHRLDTVTDGLMVIAATQFAYDYLINEQNNGRFIKFYKAHCYICNDNVCTKSGYPPINVNTNSLEFDIVSFFRPYGEGRKEVRPVTKDSGNGVLNKVKNPVEYSTQIKVVEKNENICTVHCCLKKGYRHQVRCHLAWIGFPIINDPVYGNKNDLSGEIQFTAYKIEFMNPISNKKIEIELK